MLYKSRLPRHLQPPRQPQQEQLTRTQTLELKGLIATHESKKSCTAARLTETCAAPRHVDASRYFYCIFSERAVWGEGGGEAARLESTPCIVSFRMIFFDLVATGLNL